MSASLRAGQVAEAVGVNVETLRYYERRGIIAEPERSLGGHRLYLGSCETIHKAPVRRRSAPTVERCWILSS